MTWCRSLCLHMTWPLPPSWWANWLLQLNYTLPHANMVLIRVAIRRFPTARTDRGDVIVVVCCAPSSAHRNTHLPGRFTPHPTTPALPHPHTCPCHYTPSMPWLPSQTFRTHLSSVLPYTLPCRTAVLLPLPPLPYICCPHCLGQDCLTHCTATPTPALYPIPGRLPTTPDCRPRPSPTPYTPIW